MKRRTIETGDLFCGGGGASTGMDIAADNLGLKRHGIAINHWSIAVATMRANHPETDALQMSVEEAVPADLVPGGRLDLLWASPSCTHHSRAKGGRPRSNQLRAQPELVLTWLDQLFVAHLIVENVPEFLEWGPLTADGRPMKRLAGSCFRAWVAAIEARNYVVEWRILNCADYGDATTRRRFFLQAVRKGCGRIRWPEPQYAENPETDLWGHTPKRWRGIRECLDLSDLGESIFTRRTPLSANTLRRIAAGMRKYNGLDFVATLRNHNAATGLDDPIPTISAGGTHHALCHPVIVYHFNGGRARPVDEPIGAQTTRDRYSVVTPFLITEQANNAPRGLDVPLRAQTTVRKDFLCQPLVLGQQGGAACRPIDEPCPAIATAGAIRVATPLILDMSHPGDMNDGGRVSSADAPVHSLTTRNNSAVVAMPVLADGRVIDIRMRMLKPSELAAAHSFPPGYKLTGNRGDQVKQIGNSVPVMTAAAICEAALADYAEAAS